MPTDDIRISRAGDVLHIRLNRPAKRNALTVAMYAAMADALAGAETDGTLAVIFSGEGPGFTAGNDLGDFLQNRPEGEEAPVHRFLRGIATSSRILIAAVQGKAVGVGTTMLLHCDFVVVEEDADLRMPFTDLGLVPEAASSLLVPALIGHQRAAALFLLGETMNAAQAVSYGIANRMVPPGGGVAAAEDIAARLLAKPRSAVLATKRLMKAASSTVTSRMAEEGEIFSAQLKSPEFMAIAQGFFAARQKG